MNPPGPEPSGPGGFRTESLLRHLVDLTPGEKDALANSVEIAGPDAADALAIALCHAHHARSAGRLQAALSKVAS